MSCSKVLRLLFAIGTAEHQLSGDLMLRIRAEYPSMTPPQGKYLDAKEVMAFRDFLLRTCWSPDRSIRRFARRSILKVRN
jgi:hypothetical protein